MVVKRITIITLLLLSGTVCIAGQYSELDRTGSVYLSPKFGYSLPVGALADQDYTNPAASWRKDGISFSLETGYYLSSTSVLGIEASYSTFNPKRLAVFSQDQDRSRIRIRRAGVFLQYQIVSAGRFRPFIKLGAGIFEASRFSLPQPASDPVIYRDYSLGGSPVISLGIGFLGQISQTLSASLSVESVSMKSFNLSWETSGNTYGPLNKNMLFFPVYLSLLYHFPND
jgi:hypothetical protein